MLVPKFRVNSIVSRSNSAGCHAPVISPDLSVKDRLSGSGLMCTVVTVIRVTIGMLNNISRHCDILR